MSFLLKLALWPLRLVTSWLLAASWGTRIRVALALVVLAVWQITPWGGAALTLALWLGPQWWARRQQRAGYAPPMSEGFSAPAQWAPEGQMLASPVSPVSPGWATPGFTSVSPAPIPAAQRAHRTASVPMSSPAPGGAPARPAGPPRRKSRFT